MKYGTAKRGTLKGGAYKEGTMEIIKTVTTRTGSSWPEIARALRAGCIKEMIGVGDRLAVNHIATHLRLPHFPLHLLPGQI